MSAQGNRRRRRGGTAAAASTLLGSLLLLGPGADPADAEAGPPARGRLAFNRDIRPILSENCFACHGPDARKREAELRLDDREAAVEQGAIVPGDPDASELVARVLSDDEFEVMPPPKSAKVLTAAQKETLKRWVAEGADYEPHWAYTAPNRPEVPQVGARGWARNPVDAFILYELEARGIAPSPEADRRTLIRRLALDLTGLPPTPEQVEAFVDDPAPDAYERLVDQLLASPRYGERMAVPWLDLARFADTVGYHGDQNQNIFPYRDYVVDAFNRNTPFDRFTAEQLAGDLLPDPTPEQLVATGFNRLNMVTREGGAQPKEYLAKYAADRVRTVSITWLGSTMGCAECHDHKYDPFTARDFYSLAAFFADVRQWGVYADYGYTPNPDLRGFGNDHPFPPEIEVESAALLRRRDALKGRIALEIARASAPLAGGEPGERFGRWVGALRSYLARVPSGWEVPPAEPVAGEGIDPADVARPRGDGSLLLPARPAEGRKDPGANRTIRLRPSPGIVAALRLELLPDPDHTGKVTRNGGDSGNVQLAATFRPKGKPEAKVTFARADADRKEPRFVGGAPEVGILGGWRTSAKHAAEPQAACYLLDRPVEVAEGDELLVEIRGDGAGRVRLAVAPIAPEDPRRADLDPALVDSLRADPAARSPEQSARLHAAYLRGTGWDVGALARVHRLEREVDACRDGKARTMVTRAWDPPVTRVLPRGNWQDETGAVVEPAVPGFLPQPPKPEAGRLTRLDLARWLTAADNPLTARVFANRLWKQFFGTGLSAVMEDVGAQGEAPSHPELLDWLAVEFRESGWDVKRLVRLLVTSAAYRQSSRGRPELREVDPNNRLLAAQSPRRLEAEFVRDNALSVAGLLNLEPGGPSAKPYQPGGYYANLQFPDRDYVADRDERQYRRGLYMHWQRTFLHPMLANFDAPSREECAASRTAANTPQQALTLLNDPTFVEAARALAASLLSSPPDADDSDAARIDALYRRALARPARPEECRSLLSFLETQRKAYASRPDDAKKLLAVGFAPAPAGIEGREPEYAAWTSVCRVVLNLHETLTRY